MRDPKIWAPGSICVTAIVVAFCYAQCKAEPEGAVKAIDSSEILIKALEMLEDQSKGIFQVTLLMIGALWSTLFAKPEGKSFSLDQVNAWATFALTNIALLLSAYFHIKFYGGIFNDLWLTGSQGLEKMPDFLNSWMSNDYTYQSAFLVAGLISLITHMFTVYYLQE